MIPSFGQHTHDRDILIWAAGAADIWPATVEPPAIAFILESARSRYTDWKRGWVWEHFAAPYVAAAAPDAIDWIGEYARTRPEPPLIFVWDSDVMLEVRNGVELTLLLEEDYPSEFCVTNSRTDYLVCASHEEWVYALGDALPWFERRKRQQAAPMERT